LLRFLCVRRCVGVEELAGPVCIVPLDVTAGLCWLLVQLL
jgi:hypothetical protein